MPTRNSVAAIFITAGVIAFPLAATLPPSPNIPTFDPAAAAHAGNAGSIHISNRPAPVAVVIAVSPKGSDDGDGSAARPLASLAKAKAAVRRLNRDHDVTVQLADGVYRLSAPLRFSAEDGGQNGYTVRWEAAPGAHPILSGGMPVNGWKLADARRAAARQRLLPRLRPRSSGS